MSEDAPGGSVTPSELLSETSNILLCLSFLLMFRLAVS